MARNPSTFRLKYPRVVFALFKFKGINIMQAF